MKTRDDQIRQKTRVWVFWICINVYVYKYVLSVFSLSEVFFYCLCWDIQFAIKQNIYTQFFLCILDQWNFTVGVATAT